MPVALVSDLKIGEIILIADIGGGTGDFVPYRVVKCTRSDFKLEQAGAATGSLCGSQLVNVNFLTHLENKAGKDDDPSLSFDQRCENLGRSKLDVFELANNGFEAIKKEFVPRSIIPRYVNIPGVPGNATSKWEVEITSNLMTYFYQPVVDDIFSNILSMLKENKSTKQIVVVGGMRKSELFMSQMTAKYGNKYKIKGDVGFQERSTHVVAQGAHLHYDNIETQTQEPDGYFGVAQDQEFDEDLHADVIIGRNARRTRSQKQIYFYPNHTFESFGKRKVRRRWFPINDKKEAVWKRLTVHPTDEYISRQVWWTSQKMKDGDRMLTEDGKQVMEHILEWGDVTQRCLDWKALGFEYSYFERSKLESKQVREAEKASIEDGEFEREESDDEGNEDNGDFEMGLSNGHSTIQTAKDEENGEDEAEPVVPTRSPDEIYALTSAEEEDIGGPPEVDFMEIEANEGRDVVGYTDDGRYGASIAVYVIWTKLTIEPQGANVNVKWFVAKPGEEPYDDEGNPNPRIMDIQGVGHEGVIELLDTKFSPYARD
ncbi:hypothetical protein M409DRAFT_28024 [Zasmidium cellare ATCC 36951]|uniref:Uncharacterized protein n=1 Tax=Zasmidium cellare ATCC 36951 TaxID=1080233 RepID=A0A6A6C603_ZASCE|nr:uncharacterized protein M409DRAFT_28024 [Zasmidium cellare ATCC 36951]KAF2161630.1 hypothetical protein M409DRAFT_28024 [Zasmidium cellare ATCC 36951]